MLDLLKPSPSYAASLSVSAGSRVNRLVSLDLEKPLTFNKKGGKPNRRLLNSKRRGQSYFTQDGS